MAELAGKNAKLRRKTTASATAMTDEACTEISGTRFQITDSAKRYIDKSQSVTVKVNTVVQTSGFTIEYAGGYIVFDSSHTGDTVTITGYYWTMEDVQAQFFNWSLSPALDTEEITDFASGGWKEFLATLSGVEGSAEAYWQEDEWQTPPGHASSTWGDSQPICFYLDSSGHFEGYFYVEGLDVEVPVDSVVKSDIKFKADGPVYYRSS